jgi:hypothetical protein
MWAAHPCSRCRTGTYEAFGFDYCPAADLGGITSESAMSLGESPLVVRVRMQSSYNWHADQLASSSSFPCESNNWIVIPSEPSACVEQLRQGS